LEKELIIKKAHKVLEFKQKPIFREFEEKVSDLRAEAKVRGNDIAQSHLKFNFWKAFIINGQVQ
jgi:hypothetical protein